MRKGCKEFDFYAKFEAALIAKEKAEKLALAKKHGFNSYAAYQADLQKKEQEKKEQLAKSKGYKSHKAYMAALEKKRKEEYAKKYPFTAIVGCGKSGYKTIPTAWCLKSLKINGRYVFSSTLDMEIKYGSQAPNIKVGLPSNFNLLLEPSSGRLYYLKIIESKTGKELFYDEKQNKYSIIKVRN